MDSTVQPVGGSEKMEAAVKDLLSDVQTNAGLTPGSQHLTDFAKIH